MPEWEDDAKDGLDVVPTRPDSDFGTFVWHAWQIIPAGCVVYTDGSSIDAKLGLGLEALGWAFAAFDADGTLIAAAFGVPPKDVNTIQGAELWALKQALTFVPSPGAIYVDCKTVVDGIRRGSSLDLFIQEEVPPALGLYFSGLGCGRVCWKSGVGPCPHF